jgi:phosphoribosyl 1,2-cyclic phosphodiesterase
VWGSRGSLAAPGPDTVRYGGNTSCVEVRPEHGPTLIFDAGTGMRALGVLMEHEPLDELHILLTHLHLDHLQGLGFFRPLFRPGVDVHIWGPASPVQSLAARIATYLSPPLFPVRLTDIPARLTFHDAPEGNGVTIGSATVKAAKVAHQGPTVGYRVEEHGRSLAYLPDHELSLGGMRIADQPAEWVSGYELAHGVDVLFHDAQYDDDEYASHVGWGHSCIEDVMAFTRKAAVDKLVLFHHDPYRNDEQLDALLARAQLRWSDGRERICLAQEGMTITLDAGKAVLRKP